MSNGCCGARLLVVPYVADEPSPCEFNNRALDRFLNRFFGRVNSSILMEISLVNEIAAFVLAMGSMFAIFSSAIWLALYLACVCSGPKEERKPLDSDLKKIFKVAIFFGIELILFGALLWLILGG